MVNVLLAPHADMRIPAGEIEVPGCALAVIWKPLEGANTTSREWPAWTSLSV